MNPVTGRRMALTWNYDIIWPLALEFYPAALAFLKIENKQIFTARTIRKALHSKEEMNFLEAKSAWAGFQEIIRIENKNKNEEEIFENQIGWASCNSGARLQVPEFLEAARIYFSDLGSFVDEEFLPEKLMKTPAGGGWSWNGIQFDAVVSCLGLGCPWISPELWAVKGQMFNLEGLPAWGTDILKTEHFLIPLQNGEVLAGSTYEREFEHAEPDEVGFEMITGEILPELRHKLKVSESWTGIRPTTHDRRPVIRQLDEGIFAINGMGSKGVSLSPYAAEEIMKLLYPAE
jgi:glycine/D-amino acid oxidase-like deaminating enzyme